MFQIPSAHAHTASDPLRLCFVSSEEIVLVCAASAKVQDAPELSSPFSRGDETVFPRVHSSINSFPCHFCATGAVEVSTLCLQASFRVSKTCLLVKLKMGISPRWLPCLCCPRQTLLD